MATFAGTTSENNTQLNPAAAPEKVTELLSQRDDTSRFVGLGLLKSLLDNHPALRDDADFISRCWSAISAKFLDRLLKARSGPKKSEEEARSMVDLAVAVLHTFALLLPQDAREGTKMTRRSSCLVASLSGSHAEAERLVLQILLTLADQPCGALAILEVLDLTPLLEKAPKHHQVLEIVRAAVTNVLSQIDSKELFWEKLDGIIFPLSTRFEGQNASPLFECVSHIITAVPFKPSSPSPKWLEHITNLIRSSILSNRSPAAREAAAILSSTLLHCYPSTFSSILFHSRAASKASDAKPFNYLFIILILIDIKTAFPSLLETLASTAYGNASRRLAAGFEIISAFIGHLVRSLDDHPGSFDLGMPPDLLLKLRREIAETMSLTIEFLRDRWDGAVAGAAGLDPSARQSNTEPLALTWDSKDSGILADPLILAAIRTLSLWLREDDNDSLRREGAGITDVLLGLYGSSSQASETDNEHSLDFRSPVLLALEGILATDAGLEAFLTNNGWATLWKDLQPMTKPPSTSPSTSNTTPSSRATDIIRVLLAVAEHPDGTGTHEEWMAVVHDTASLTLPADDVPPDRLDLHTSLYQLSTELLAKAPRGMRKRYARDAVRIADGARGMVSRFGGVEGTEEFVDSALEVEEGLEGLSLGV
ncbi:MAG: hypothetical protein M1833_004288 [Piccolia ochrophora]|nr:MAG: hypothetical protein M1833_004288 [Piccolia ochrophora]